MFVQHMRLIDSPCSSVLSHRRPAVPKAQMDENSPAAVEDVDDVKRIAPMRHAVKISVRVCVFAGFP
jgi:hypothetical protein